MRKDAEVVASPEVDMNAYEPWSPTPSIEALLAERRD